MSRGATASARRNASAFEIPEVELVQPTALLAIDPGAVHCGMAWADTNKLGEWQIFDTDDLAPVDCLDTVCDWLSQDGPGVLVVEGFRLYPHLAPEQGLSAMGTPEVIGAIKWVYLSSGRDDVAFYEQGASVKQAGCNFLNEQVGGSCHHERKGGQRIWKHDVNAHIGTNPHKRDAEAHAWYRIKRLGGEK